MKPTRKSVVNAATHSATSGHQAIGRRTFVRLAAATLIGCALITGLAACGGGAATQPAATAATSAALTPQQRSDIDQNEATKAHYKALIIEVESARVLIRNMEGTMGVQPIAARSATLSSAAETFVQGAVSGLNAQIKAGTLVVDCDLTVRQPGVPSSTRANAEGFVGYRWWGYTYAFDNTHCNRIMGDLAAGAGLATIAGAISGPESYPVAAVLSGAAGFFGGIILHYDAAGRGTYYNQTWVEVGWLSSQ